MCVCVAVFVLVMMIVFIFRSCLSLASDIVKTLCEKRTSCVLLGEGEGGGERERGGRSEAS